MAKKGFNVVLIGRREGATQEVADEIGKYRVPIDQPKIDNTATKYTVETKVVAIDVSKPEERKTGFAKMEELAKTLDIGILGKLLHAQVM